MRLSHTHTHSHTPICFNVYCRPGIVRVHRFPLPSETIIYQANIHTHKEHRAHNQHN